MKTPYIEWIPCLRNGYFAIHAKSDALTGDQVNAILVLGGYQVQLGEGDIGWVLHIPENKHPALVAFFSDHHLSFQDKTSQSRRHLPRRGSHG